jgi:hypothetical protein
MNIAAAVSSGVHGAWLLARGRADGLRFVEADAAGAARSFWAIAICLPSFICLRLIAWTLTGSPPHAAHVLTMDLLGYGIRWCGFAVLSHRLLAEMGLAERWPRFIALWNWCGVVQYLLLAAFSVPVLLGVPAPLGEAAQLFALGWAMWLEWFAFRLVLEIGVMAAMRLVAVDMAIGVLVAAVAIAI